MELELVELETGQLAGLGVRSLDAADGRGVIPSHWQRRPHPIPHPAAFPLHALHSPLSQQQLSATGAGEGAFTRMRCATS